MKKDLFNDKYIKVIGQTEWNDFRWEGSPSDKRALINGADFIFSASPTLANALGSKVKLVEQEVNDCLLHCSDAHQVYDGEYTSKVLGHCYTWIKSDTTFDGLKQVVYEPQRVNLSEINPNQKNNYQYIKEVKLVDDGELFGEQVIGLNQDLNSIIGGKSSGKSLLLYHIAKSVMSYEKFEKISSIEGFQKYDNLPVFELEAKWADGHVSKLSEYEGKRPIVYIPQMYLNYMAEKKSRNEDFKQTIYDILKSNDGYKEYIDEKQNEILTYEQQINSGVKEYFLHLNKFYELNRELLQLGDRTAIETNITIINAELESLQSTADFTVEEASKYSELNQNNKEISERRDIF